MPEHIFISYAHRHDEVFATRLHDKLMAEGFIVWLDHGDVEISAGVPRSIEEPIRGCWVLIFVATKNSIDSAQCWEEWNLALSLRKPILPLLLEPVQLPSLLHLRQRIDFSGDFVTALAKLRRHLTWIRSTRGELQTLRDRLVDLERELATGISTSREAIRAEIRDLHELISQKERVLAQSDISYFENQLRRTTQEKVAPIESGLPARSVNDEITLLEAFPGEASKTQELQMEAKAEFIGREKAIADMEELVKRGTKVILIRGVGGVGKTVLAWNFFQGQKLGLILELWMAMETQDISSVESRIEEWLVGNFGEEPGREFGITLERFRHQLRDKSRRVGVLIDNLEPALDENGKFIQPHRRYVDLLRVLADPTVRAITLITSRESLREPSVTVQDYYLRGLDEVAWQQFFKDIEIQVDPDLLSLMHKAYGGNPKAMRIISGTIKNDFAGNAEAYWQVYHNNLLSEQDLENLITEQFDRLKRIDPPSYKLLCRLGCYRYQAIPTVPINGIVCLLWDVPDEQKLRVFKSLQDRSLIEFSEGQCWLHTATRLEAVSRLRASEEWRVTNLTAAAFWTDSVDTIQTSEDALRALEAYYHYVAINDFERAGNVFLKRRNSPERDLSNGGEPLDAAFYRLGLLQQQVSAITQIIDKVPLSFTKGRLYDVLGLSYRLQGQIRDAMECYTNLQRIADEIASQELKVCALTLISYCKMDLWEIEEAILFFNKLVSASENTAFHRYAILAWSYLAYLYSYLDSEEKHYALDFIKMAEGSLERADLNTWRKAYGALLIGVAYKNLGNHQKAFEMCSKAISDAIISNHPQVWARALSCQAELYEEQGDFGNAVRQHLKAIELSDKIGNLCDLADAHYQAGLTYKNIGEIEKSKESFQLAIRFFSQIGAPKQINKVLLAMAT